MQVTTKKIQWIHDRLHIVQSRQKNYADTWRKNLEFEVEDKIFLQISPTKGVLRFGKKGKLSRRYIGLYKILEKVGHVVDLSHVLKYEPLQIREDLTHIEHLVQILDRRYK